MIVIIYIVGFVVSVGLWLWLDDDCSYSTTEDYIFLSFINLFWFLVTPIIFLGLLVKTIHNLIQTKMEGE